MSDMERATFAANGSVEPSGLARESLMILVTGNFGGGTLAIQKWSHARTDFVTVTLYTAVTVTADEIKLGKGRFRFVLTGATTPSLDIDYWSM